MEDQEIKTLLAEIKESQNSLREEVKTSAKNKKDNWDKLKAIAPLISGGLIFSMGGYFTYSYNQQQLKIQEIQTIERFIPHMLGDEREKKAAILAMSSLANTQLAARFASLFASEGTVSALKSIATTGDTKDRTIANTALEQALDNIADHYYVENKFTQAEQAYQEALALKSRTLGPDHPDIPRALDKLAELYKAQGKYSLAEQLLKRSLATREKIYGADDPTLAGTLKSLSEVLRLEGKLAEAEPLNKRTASIDEQLMQATNTKPSTDAEAQPLAREDEHKDEHKVEAVSEKNTDKNSAATEHKDGPQVNSNAIEPPAEASNTHSTHM